MPKASLWDGTPLAKGVFSRAKVLTMKRLVLFIMSSKSALQRGLDDFYGKINTGDYSIREVTKGAFSTARNKLNEWGFRHFNEVCVDYYAHAPYHKWKNFPLLMAAYAHPIEEKVRAEYKAEQNRKHDQKINRTHALAMTRDMLMPCVRPNCQQDQRDHQTQ